MAEEEKERIIIPDENGEEHLFEVLFTFDVDETEKSYMVLVPVESSEEDEEDVEVFAFRYEDKGEKDDDIELFPIETDAEWDMVEEMLNTFQDSEEL
ncbi:DUF1292 domain-containing protein [Pseudalkalibacillus sp. Hm43]|uniref:DUF1292 domain-containing protein n=1 Tax=Pseudalkalibacillus sp. Hm43 TaxID=3450742 RepID=UPI001CFA16E9